MQTRQSCEFGGRASLGVIRALGSCELEVIGAR